MDTGFIGQAKGLTNSYWSPLAIPEMTEELIVRAFEWFDRVSAAEGSIKDNGYLIFKIMQKVKSIPNATFKSHFILTAQIRQHPTLRQFAELQQHGLILKVLDMSSFSEPAVTLTPAKARFSWHESLSWKGTITSSSTTRSPKEISFPTRLRTSMTRKRYNCPSSGLESLKVTDDMQMFGEHYEQLQELKRKYDPGSKLKGPINLDVAAQA